MAYIAPLYIKCGGDVMCKGVEFRELQKKSGLSNKQMADYLGMNISTIKRYRNESLIPPKLVFMAIDNLLDSNLKQTTK